MSAHMKILALAVQEMSARMCFIKKLGQSKAFSSQSWRGNKAKILGRDFTKKCTS